MNRRTDYAPLSELVARVDLAELVERYTGTPGKGKDSCWTFPCPNPGHADHSPSFTVRRMPNGRQHARCWSQCDWGGDALELVQWLEGCTVAEAAARLRAHIGETEPVTHTMARAPKRTTPPEPARPTVHEPDNTGTVPAGTGTRIMRDHLAHRGWPDTVPERFGLTVVLDRFGKPRIRYPFHAWDGATWAVGSWQDRATSPGQKPKYMTPKGAVLPPYNVRALDTVHELAAVVVCEGAPDAITATLALEHRPDMVAIGVPGANNWRAEWAQLLTTPTVVVAADPDRAGENLPAAVLAALGRPVVVLNLAGGDLTETAKRYGLAAVTELLAATVETTEAVEPDNTGTVTDTGRAGLAVPIWVRYAALAELGPKRWRRCTVCGEAALTETGSRCYMTPKCAGRFAPITPEAVSA